MKNPASPIDKVNRLRAMNPKKNPRELLSGSRFSKAATPFKKKVMAKVKAFTAKNLDAQAKKIAAQDIKVTGRLLRSLGFTKHSGFHYGEGARWVAPNGSFSIGDYNLRDLTLREVVQDMVRFAFEKGADSMKEVVENPRQYVKNPYRPE